MSWAEQPSTDASAETQIRPLVGAGPLGGDDPLVVPHKKEVASAHGDRHQRPTNEKVVRAEVNPLGPLRLSHRDRRPAHAGPR